MEAMDIGSPLENINIEQVCRACFETCEQYKLLFEDAAGTEKLSLGDVFSDVAKIEIKTNPVSLPNRICLACSRDLLSAHKFIRKSQQNNNRLLEYLKNSSSTKQPDCLSEFPIDIPVPFLQIKVEKEAISEYPEPLDEDKISPSSSNGSVASDFDESPLHKDEKLNKLQCTYCNRIFKRMNCLESHKKKHEEEIKKKEATEEGSSSFLCDECGHSCATKFDLKSHRLAAHTTRKAPSDVTQTEASCSAVIDKPQNQNLDADKEKNKECVESASLPEIKQEFYPSSISPALASLMASTSLENASTTKNMFIFSERFFTIVKQLNDTDFQKKHNGLVAECSTCKSRVQGSFQITSNFTRHLRIKHPNVFKEYESIKGSNPVQKPKPTMQEQFDELLIKFLVNNMIPLGIVEDSSLRNLLTFTHSNLRVVNRPMALGVVNKLYFEMLDKMKDTIAASKYFCTTADVWIIQRQCFFGYTCHWLDEHCQRQKYALACKRFPEPPTNDKVTKIIREVHSEYGLNGENIVAIVTDNGENYLKELNIVDIYTEVEDDKNLENVLQKPLKTVTVSLNLIATDDLNSILSKKPAIYAKHKSVMQKCTELWDKVRECRTSEKILSAVGTQLKFPMASKWDTVYDSIKELFVHRRNLTILCEGLELPILTNEDFEYLEEYLQMLTPIAEALDFMQNPCVMLYGYLLPTLATVRNKFRRMATNSFFKTLNVEIVSLLETALVDRFLNYFDLTDEAHNAIVASVLCPSVKLKWISALNPSFNDEKIVEVSALVRRAIQAEYDGSHISEQREAPVDVPFFDFSINAEQSEITPSTSSANTTMDPTAQNEYFAYLANPMTSPDMLNRYPTVKKAFYRVISSDRESSDCSPNQINSVDKCDDRCIRLERWAVIPPPEQTQTITKDNSDILMLKLELSNLKETCVKEFSEIKALILKQNEAKNSTNEYKKTVIHKDDEAPQSVINLFPINSDEQLNSLNNFDDTQKLSAITTAKQLISYGGLCQNMNRIFGNRIVVNYNYDGKRGKKSLKELSNVNEILFKAAFRNGYTMLDYEGDLRKGFKIMKNRYFKNECMKRKKVDLR